MRPSFEAESVKEAESESADVKKSDAMISLKNTSYVWRAPQSEEKKGNGRQIIYGQPPPAADPKADDETKKTEEEKNEEQPSGEGDAEKSKKETSTVEDENDADEVTGLVDVDLKVMDTELLPLAPGSSAPPSVTGAPVPVSTPTPAPVSVPAPVPASALAVGSSNPASPQHEVSFLLDSVSLEARAGDLVAVVGPVGSGKSSLVSAMLGEMERTQGEASMRGSVAYVAQIPWILNTTVQDNILFGAPFDKSRYQQAVQCSQLAADLKQLPSGDQTLIGERGINLSGGQKQRVTARTMCVCIYIYCCRSHTEYSVILF
jgi:ABC-type multidrug transport system fused ATPase/permease subunit